MDDAALLAGVPDDLEAGADDELLLFDPAEEEAAAPRPASPASAASPACAAAPLFSGKRKVIEHTFSPDAMVGVDPDDEEERAKRHARASKFGVPVRAPPAALAAGESEAAPLIDAKEVAARHARAKKWGVAPIDPLEAVEKAAPKDAFWAARRDAAAEETPRPEAVHVFGTDRMSSDDLLRFFFHAGVTPKHVEWVNDSSANVVFADAAGASAAVLARTVPLIPGAEGFDTSTWRTLAPSLAAAGKGLQLLFRMATAADIKPARRGVSRWYGELQPARPPAVGGAIPPRRAAVAPPGAQRMATKTLAETISAGKTLADVIASSAHSAEAMAHARFPGGPPIKSDLRTKLAGRKEKAVKHEAGELPDLRKVLASGTGDFKRGRTDKAGSDEDDDDDEAAEPRSNFSYAAAKAELESYTAATAGIDL